MEIKNEYTVNEVAEIFQTNPETVRKWIKTEKLTAYKGNSKKEGMRITEKSLEKFLSVYPKYTKTAFTSSAAALITGGTALAGSLIATVLLSKYSDELEIQHSKIKSEDLIPLLKEEIELEKETLNQKKAEFEKIKKEIEEHDKRIKNVKTLIDELS